MVQSPQEPQDGSTNSQQALWCSVMYTMPFIMLHYPWFHLAVRSAGGGLLGYRLINQEVTGQVKISPL